MNFELFVAKRISYRSERTFSKIVVRIAVAAIVLSVAIMLISVSIIKGFQSEIRGKIIGFGSHIQVAHTNFNRSFESLPINESQEFYQNVLEMPQVRSIQSFAYKPAIFRATEEIDGMVIKGITHDFDWSIFSQWIIRGEPLVFNDTEAINDIIISKAMASRLQLDTGSRVLAYFVQDPPRIRNFSVKGIFETGLDEVDNSFVLADLKHIRRLNDWEDNQIGGYEVFLHDLDDVLYVDDEIRFMTDLNADTYTIHELYPQIFDWLNLLNVNVQIILILMIVVASINMITALLIMILEKTQLIGIFKALGTANAQVRKIFVYSGMYLIAVGIIAGNILGLSLLFIQREFNVITLPQESYYVAQVPVLINFVDIILINVGTLVVCTLILYLPALLVSKVTPLKALRFE